MNGTGFAGFGIGAIGVATDSALISLAGFATVAWSMFRVRRDAGTLR